MCGIAGFWQPEGLRGDARGALQRMTDAIRHRGPDGDGQWLDAEAGIALGHRRLAILDLSDAGAQPMFSPSGRFAVVFNGEVYNWRALRAEETQLGTAWRGHSDTEVLLALCDRVGILEAVKRTTGMLAMAIWDRSTRSLTLVRDRLGEKPLYYGWCGNTFLFGSELKALRAHPEWHGTIDRGAMTLYMRHNYVPGPYSIYEQVRKLQAGTSVTLQAAGPRWPEPVVYWSAIEEAQRGHADPLTGSPKEIADELERLMMRVIGDEMVADVPLGAFLSGGIDSSLIVALMQAQSARPVKTFTIGFHETAFNEAGHAQAVAWHLGTEHQELYVTPQVALEVVPKLPAMFDEPFADSSQLPTYLVAEMTRQHVTVALSGDGGDETFGGYHRYFMAPRLWRWLAPFPRAARKMAAQAVRGITPGTWDRLIDLTPGDQRKWIHGDRIHKLAGLLELPNRRAIYHAINSHWRDPASIIRGGHEPLTGFTDPSRRPRLKDFTSEMMALDTAVYLPDDILVKVDRTSMAVSLEVRAPFLHHEIYQFAWRIPLAQRNRQMRGKLPLRMVLDRHVPSHLVDRPKLGFGVPIDSWLRGPLRAWAEEMLTTERLKRTDIFDPAPIRKLWTDHQNGSRSRQYLLWDVLMAMAWLDAQGAGVT